MTSGSGGHGSEHGADGAVLVPSAAFGVATRVAGAVHFLDGQRLLYPAGQFFATLSIEDGKASFIPSTPNTHAALAHLSPSRRYLAVAELLCEGGDHQHQVSVFNVPAEKKERTLSLSPHTNGKVTALSFSADAKLLVVASGGPAGVIMLWRWQQAKMLQLLAAEPGLCCASLSPWDEGLLVCAGAHVVRSHRLDLKAGASPKHANLLMLDSHGASTITCLIHLVGGLVAVGTSTGEVLVCGPTGTLASFDINTPPETAAAGEDNSHSSSGHATGAAVQAWEAQAGDGASAASPHAAVGAPAHGGSAPAGSSHLHRGRSGPGGHTARNSRRSAAGHCLAEARPGLSGVQALVQRGRGFLAVGSRGDVVLFEPPGAASVGRRSDKADVFALTRRFSFVSSSSSSSSGGGGGGDGQSCAPPEVDDAASSSAGGSTPGRHSNVKPLNHLPTNVRVTGVSVSATDDHVVVATADGKLLLLNVTAAIEAADDAAADAASLEAAAAALGTAPGTQGHAGATPGSGPNAVEVAGAGSKLEANELHLGNWQPVVCSGCGTSRVVGLDACQHLPLLLVTSEDGWVCALDWVRRVRVAARQLVGKQVLCCCLHPSGLMAAVGTSEALHVFWILRRALSPVAQLPVVRCSVARYSHGGGLIAAAGRSNAIVVYPAFYGQSGASGGAPVGTRASAAAAAAAGGSHLHSTAPQAGGGGASEAALVPVAVLKGHVGAITDVAFTSDDRRLVSSGAGGAVYWWDLATGARLVQLDYVDKQLAYCAACFSDSHAAAIVRTVGGCVQHVQDGQVMHEAAGLGPGSCPMALAGGGAVVLAATAAGSVISIGWPKKPGLEAERDTHRPGGSAAGGHAGGINPASFFQGTSGSGGAVAAEPAGGKGSHTGAAKHLRVQVDDALHGPPARAAGAQGSSGPAGSCSAAGGNAPQAQAAPVAAAPPVLQLGCAAGRPGEGGGALPAGWHEYRLHSSPITAMRVLHAAGVLFTASADGLVLMSSLSLVLDGALFEAPPPVLAPSAAAHLGGSMAVDLGVAATRGPGGASGTQSGPPGSVPGMPSPLVLVDEGLVLAMQERVRLVQLKLQALQKEAQFQVLRQTQALREALAASDSRAAALGAQMEQLQEALRQAQEEATSGQDKVVKELEALHLAAAEQLEGLYEARLALEAERLRQLAAAKDDLELSLREQLQRQTSAADKQLTEVHSMYRQQLAAEAARSDAAAAAAKEAEAVWTEVLMQTEEDLDKRAEHDGNRLASVQRSAEEADVKLRAEANILARANARLKAEKEADAARAAALQQRVAALEQQLADAAVVAGKLRAELGKRDAVISDNYGSMQGLRHRMQELETHKFVLTHKAEAVAAELQPKEEQLEELQATIHAQDRELLAGRSSLLAAKRAVCEKGAAVAAAKQEVWHMKHRMAHQAALLDAVAHDIANVLQQPPDARLPGGKTAAQNALEQLSVKYTKRGGGPRTSMQVEAEMAAQIAAAERKSNILEAQLREAQAHNERSRRRLMADNSVLLADLAELQRTNRQLTNKLADAAHQLASQQLQAGQAGEDELGVAPSAPDGQAAAPPTCTPAATSSQRGPSPSFERVGRSQGAHSPGRLLPAHEGRVLDAALRQQLRQLAELQGMLEATTGVVALQAAQIARLQQRAADTRQGQHCPEDEALPGGGDPGVAGSQHGAPGDKPCSPQGSRQAGPRPQTAGGRLSAAPCAWAPAAGGTSSGGPRASSGPGPADDSRRPRHARKRQGRLAGLARQMTV